MKKDSRMLEELRKGPLAGMDEDEFKMIEEDVKKFGFKGLSGYAKSTVQRAIRLMGGEINKAIAQRKAELEKHGDHDQSTHSPTGGAGKDIQDLSPSDQKTFTSRMSSAKDYQEQRKIIEEYKVKLPKKISKAKSVSVGDRVSWNASGGTAEGKVLRIERSGKINVPDSSFEIEGSEDDPAALIVLYRDGKPTDTKVGHKVSTLKKK
jgi:hypothetical protein